MSALWLAPRNCIKHCNSTATCRSIQISFSWNLHWNYTRTYFHWSSKTITGYCIDWNHWLIKLKFHRFLRQMCYSLEFHIFPCITVATKQGNYYLIFSNHLSFPLLYCYLCSILPHQAYPYLNSFLTLSWTLFINGVSWRAIEGYWN